MKLIRKLTNRNTYIVPKLAAAIFVCTFIISIFFGRINVYSQSFSSDSYHIDWGNFNVTSGKKSSTNYQLTDTVGQNAPGLFNSNGYVVKAGFQYIYDTSNKFSFIIDDLSIDFGALVPNISTTQTNTITISTPSGQGYQIMAHENHPLKLSSGTTIPDTRCDSNNCSEATADLWTSNSTYGFGLNALGINTSGVVTGVGTSGYFSTVNHFRQFADYSAIPPESNQIIMAESSPVKEHSARITYKVNISPQQSSGKYQNTVTFTAVPRY